MSEGDKFLAGCLAVAVTFIAIAVRNTIILQKIFDYVAKQLGSRIVPMIPKMECRYPKPQEQHGPQIPGGKTDTGPWAG